MPSRFEPCGLAQQYAMRYGTIPVVRKTGGLADTVTDLNNNHLSPNGFLFVESTCESLINVIHRAIELYRKPDLFKKIRQNCLNSSCSWDLAAKKYLEVYDWALKEKSSA